MLEIVMMYIITLQSCYRIWLAFLFFWDIIAISKSFVKQLESMWLNYFKCRACPSLGRVWDLLYCNGFYSRQGIKTKFFRECRNGLEGDQCEKFCVNYPDWITKGDGCMWDYFKIIVKKLAIKHHGKKQSFLLKKHKGTIWSICSILEHCGCCLIAIWTCSKETHHTPLRTFLLKCKWLAIEFWSASY